MLRQIKCFSGLVLLIFLSLNIAHAGIIAQPAPDFSLPDAQGKLHRLTDWQGKVVILNFWATWCGPCKKEIPLLNAMQKDYGSDELQIVGIAIDNPKAVEQFIQLIPIEYLYLIGGTRAVKLVSRYGNTEGVLPYTVIIDPKGKIASIAKGLLTEKYLRRVIERNQ